MFTEYTYLNYNYRLQVIAQWYNKYMIQTLLIKS